MNKKTINYMGVVISAIQLLLIAIPFVFEYLSKSKALLMRHLYTKKLDHLNTILDVTHRNIYATIILIITVTLLFILIKNANIKLKDFIVNVILVLVLVFMLSFDLFSAKLTFTYSIIILAFVWMLDIIKLFMKINFRKKYKNFN
ncbi:MAG: hypothetical protein WBA54_08475 [Acidaminobacteraceae bacterium]